eukprot:GHVH01003587.1.p1 GENE.GHVH01003587.1~~GHVH01003587.1.p1  ORF type:complete len:390 (-),score=25.98 GHVH01003587.1:578-1672(-)
MSEEARPTILLCGRLVEMRWIALGALVVQTVSVISTMRISKAFVTGDGYINTTAVVMSELVKMICSFFLLARDLQSFKAAGYETYHKIVKEPAETLKVGVPAALYTIQNNLLFVAISNMPAALYQVSYQLKILTTAFLSMIILNKHISAQQWVGLVALFAGVALIQMPSGDSSSKPDSPHVNLFLGLVAVVSACFTSGFAGVYFEKILKGSSTSIWLRNIQLGLFGTVLGLAGCIYFDGDRVASQGFFTGYNALTVTVILLQSAGGLIVAMVLKYADNILKCFGNTMAILFSCMISWHLGDYEPSIFFVFGTCLVVAALFLYSLTRSQIESMVGINKISNAVTNHLPDKESVPSHKKGSPVDQV